jgi:hypothetical protein
MSTFDLGAPVPRRTGTHLPLAGRQLVRNREIGRSKVCTIEPLVARSITQRRITARLQLEWGADGTPAWHGERSGCLRCYPGWEVSEPPASRRR